LLTLLTRLSDAHDAAEQPVHELQRSLIAGINRVPWCCDRRQLHDGAEGMGRSQ